MTDEQLIYAFNTYAMYRQNNQEAAEMFLRVLKSDLYDDSFGGVKSPEELVRIQILFKIRLDSNNTCCQCGACCDRVLGLTAKERKEILRYLKENPEVKEYITMINKGHPHRKCPFLDHTKGSQKCMIYGKPFFPIICSTYCCDEKLMNKQLQGMMYIIDGMPELLDLWHYFLDDPVDITGSWRLKDAVSSEFNIRLGPPVLLEPEKMEENLRRYMPDILRSLYEN